MQETASKSVHGKGSENTDLNATELTLLNIARFDELALDNVKVHVRYYWRYGASTTTAYIHQACWAPLDNCLLLALQREPKKFKGYRRDAIHMNDDRYVYICPFPNDQCRIFHITVKG